MKKQVWSTDFLSKIYESFNFGCLAATVAATVTTVVQSNKINQLHHKVLRFKWQIGTTTVEVLQRMKLLQKDPLQFLVPPLSILGQDLDKDYVFNQKLHQKI